MRLTVMNFEPHKPKSLLALPAPGRETYGLGPVVDILRHNWESELAHQRLIVKLKESGSDDDGPASCALCRDEGMYMTARGVLEPCICVAQFRQAADYERSHRRRPDLSPEQPRLFP
jgi:hypothetical protein